jgi:O-antigen/teichoic acid export membrane protein
MASGGVLSFARLLSGVIRVKVLALALGVSGVGIYALMLQLYLTGIAVASMSLAVPIINLGRKPVVAGDDREAGSIAGTALAVVCLNCLLLAIFAALFGKDLLGWMGISADTDRLILPLTLAVIFGAMSGAFWEGMSYLCDRFDAYVKVGVISAVTDMIFISSGALLFGLRGAIFGLPFGPIALFVSYSFFVGRDPTARRVLRNLSLRAQQLPRLLTYSAMMFTAVATTQIGLTFLRSRVLVEGGASANGYLQTATSLAAYTLAFVMTGFWGHLHAHAAAAGDTAEVRTELGQALRLGLFIAFTGCGSAAVLADFLIPLFYSSNFAPGTQVLTAYMPGELCFQLFSMLVAYQLTVSLRRLYLGLSLGYILVLAAAGALLIPIMGGMGYAAAHNIASFGILISAIAFAWRRRQIDSGFVFLAAALVAAMTIVAILLLAARGHGYSGLILLPAILPFAISGYVALTHLTCRFPPALRSS